LLNALTSKIIKRVVRQPRPPTSKKGGYGMPSSHAHLLFYFLTISSLLSRKHYPSYLSLAVALSLGMYAVSASYWRVVDGLRRPFWNGSAVFNLHMHSKQLHLFRSSDAAMSAAAFALVPEHN
jgi:hypothetical protein